MRWLVRDKSTRVSQWGLEDLNRLVGKSVLYRSTVHIQLVNAEHARVEQHLGTRTSCHVCLGPHAITQSLLLEATESKIGQQAKHGMEHL